MQRPQSGFARIIEAIDKPLGFYVLALLIVESFLTVVLIFSELGAPVQERGMWAGVGLFGGVVLIVTVIVWNKPTHLTFTELGSLIQMGKVSYGTDTNVVAIKNKLPSGVAAPVDDQ